MLKDNNAIENDDDGNEIKQWQINLLNIRQN